eukprot:3699484-Pyramimonas_sp.AAC.1
MFVRRRPPLAGGRPVEGVAAQGVPLVPVVIALAAHGLHLWQALAAAPQSAVAARPPQCLSLEGA